MNKTTRYIIITIGSIIILGLVVSGIRCNCYPKINTDGSFMGFKCGGSF